MERPTSSQHLGYSSLTLHVRRGRRVHLLGHRQADGRAGFAFPRAVDERQLHDLGQRGHDSDDATQYSYCVSGDKLTMTPQTTSPTMTGTIVLAEGGQLGYGRHDGQRRRRHGGSGGAGGAAAGRRTGSAAHGAAARGSGGTGRGGSGGTTGSGGQAGSGGTRGSGGAAARLASGGASAGGTHRRTKGPCDIYAAADTPCVAAHSTVRALYGAYAGKLYQVRRSDNTTKDILTLAAGGVADAAPQDTFCSGTTCVITVLYDQSGQGQRPVVPGIDRGPRLDVEHAPRRRPPSR